MTAIISKNRSAFTGIAGLALAAALSATVCAFIAPAFAAGFAANAAPAATGQVSLVGQVTDNGAGAFSGK